jgi:hypothetical protein
MGPTLTYNETTAFMLPYDILWLFNCYSQLAVKD